MSSEVRAYNARGLIYVAGIDPVSGASIQSGWVPIYVENDCDAITVMIYDDGNSLQSYPYEVEVWVLGEYEKEGV